jgi:hypothetical protein
VPLPFSSQTYHSIREDGAGFSFYFESIYEPAIVVMVLAILSITLFMGIAIFFLESSSGSIRIDWGRRAMEKKKKIWNGARGSLEISLKLATRISRDGSTVAGRIQRFVAHPH